MQDSKRLDLLTKKHKARTKNISKNSKTVEKQNEIRQDYGINKLDKTMNKQEAKPDLTNVDNKTWRMGCEVR